MATLNPAVGTGAYTDTLATLRARVMRRIGFGAQIASPPPGVAALIDEFLQSAQTQLMQKFPDLVLERFFQWTMVAGTRFYAADNDDEGATNPDYKLDPKQVTWVGLEDLNGAFIPLKEGIDAQWYTMESQRGLPQRYEIRQAIEVMPSPDQAYKLTIKGRFRTLPFAADSDVTSIDPELLFLLAVANAKAHYGQRDAGNYFTQATTYLGDLVSNAHGTKCYVPQPGGEQPPEPKPVLV